MRKMFRVLMIVFFGLMIAGSAVAQDWGMAFTLPEVRIKFMTDGYECDERVDYNRKLIMVGERFGTTLDEFILTLQNSDGQTVWVIGGTVIWNNRSVHGVTGTKANVQATGFQYDESYGAMSVYFDGKLTYSKRSGTYKISGKGGKSVGYTPPPPDGYGWGYIGYYPSIKGVGYVEYY